MLHSVLQSGPSPEKECIARMCSDIMTAAWPLRAIMYTSMWVKVFFAELISTDEIFKISFWVFGGYCTTLSRSCSVIYVTVVSKIKTVCIPIRARMELIWRVSMRDIKFQISLKSFQQFLLKRTNTEINSTHPLWLDLKLIIMSHNVWYLTFRAVQIFERIFACLKTGVSNFLFRL